MVASGGPGNDGRSDDLDRRRRDLEAKLSAHRKDAGSDESDDGPGRKAGYGQALKMSSEFIAGVAVGAVLGWGIDRFAGTSPWGLIVFLLLGFAAGVLNVLRSAGMIAEPGLKVPERDAKGPDAK